MNTTWQRKFLQTCFTITSMIQVCCNFCGVRCQIVFKSNIHLAEIGEVAQRFEPLPFLLASRSRGDHLRVAIFSGAMVHTWVLRQQKMRGRRSQNHGPHNRRHLTFTATPPQPWRWNLCAESRDGSARGVRSAGQQCCCFWRGFERHRLRECRCE